MIDYRDFQQQAELDIRRAEKLYKEEDYGFSIYSAQQGLEKYLKAYLMKFNLISDPQKLGHLQYDAIIDMILEELKHKKDLENDSFFTEFLNAVITYFRDIKEILDTIKSSEQKKNLLWKESLKIELNQNDQNIIYGLNIKMDSLQNRMRDNLSKVFNESMNSILKNALMESSTKREKAGISILQSIQDIVQTKYDNYDHSKFLDSVFSIIRPHLYGTGNDSVSKDDTDFIVVLMRLIKTLEWMAIVLMSFLHEQISRYPTTINDSDSVTLYKQNKDAVWKLIQEMIDATEKIRLNLNSF